MGVAGGDQHRAMAERTTILRVPAGSNLHGLNLPGTRPGKFGTFGLSVYSSLGAESLHPISPLTTTLNYGVIDRDGTVSVRLVYDHRVFDGATAARALGKLEEILKGPILAELRSMIPSTSQLAA